MGSQRSDLSGSPAPSRWTHWGSSGCSCSSRSGGASPRCELVSPSSCPPPGGVVRTIAENFFSSPYLANYHLGDGGLLGEPRLHGVQRADRARDLVRRRHHARVHDRSRRSASRHSRSRRAHGRDHPDPGDGAVLPDLVRHEPRCPDRLAASSMASTIVYLFAQRAVANLDPVYVGRRPDARRELQRGSSSTSISWGRFPRCSAASGSPSRAPGVSRPCPSCSALRNGIGRVIQAMGSGMDTPDHGGGDPRACHRRRGVRRDRRRVSSGSSPDGGVRHASDRHGTADAMAQVRLEHVRQIVPPLWRRRGRGRRRT